MDQSLQIELWQRLVSGKPLDGLKLGEWEGRIDARGILFPKPQVVRRYPTKFWDVTEIVPNGVFRNVRLRDFDFSDSSLESLQFWDSEIINCRFDRCRLRNMRLSLTTFRDCSFRRADLRGSGLGIPTPKGSSGYGGNIYQRVDFTETDLRDTLYIAGAFVGCIFRCANLTRINFASSTFTDCRFEGELKEVQFWRSDMFIRPKYPKDAFPENEMSNCDFSGATLRDVEFRGINLDDVRLPNNTDHIIVQHYSATLDWLIGALQQQGDRTARILVAGLEIGRKWAAPHSRGYLNKHDLAEAGEDAVERVLELLKQFEGRIQ